MSRPPRIDYPGAIHHVIVRGVERRRIFLDDRDRRRFLGLLAEYQPRFDLGVLAYCLMGNHVHLVTRTGRQALHIGLHCLLGSYAMSFNRRHERVGHLFAGRYKAFLVEKEAYLLTLVRYVHANPVRARITDRPEMYRWSSDRAYRDGAPPRWLDVQTLLSTLDASPRRAREAYRSLSTIDEARPPAHSGVVQGSRTFALLQLGRVGRESILGDVSPEEFARTVADRKGLEWTALLGSGGSREIVRARALVGLAARRIARIPVAATARYMGLSVSSLSRAIHGLTSRSASADLGREIEAIRTVLCLTARIEARPQMHGRGRG